MGSRQWAVGSRQVLGAGALPSRGEAVLRRQGRGFVAGPRPRAGVSARKSPPEGWSRPPAGAGRASLPLARLGRGGGGGAPRGAGFGGGPLRSGSPAAPAKGRLRLSAPLGGIFSSPRDRLRERARPAGFPGRWRAPSSGPPAPFLVTAAGSPCGRPGARAANPARRNRTPAPPSRRLRTAPLRERGRGSMGRRRGRGIRFWRWAVGGRRSWMTRGERSCGGTGGCSRSPRWCRWAIPDFQYARSGAKSMGNWGSCQNSDVEWDPK